MKLETILKGIDYKLIKGNLDSVITDICYDSRKVIKDSLFICLVGSTTDGHDYIDSAIKNGASTIIIERDIDIKEDVNVIKINNTRRVLSRLSINFFDNPASKMTVIGITGTKGKTTTSWMIKNILEEDHKKVGVIGTMGVFIGDKHYSTVNTTPESYEIQKYFKEMVDNGVEYAVMEVSSQALKVGRVDGMMFDYGIFTNLTRDHIGDNEHPDMEDYIYSKSLLFKMCKKGVFNIDDSNFNSMIKDSTCEVYTYGHNNEANLVIDNVELLRKEHFIGVNVSVKGLINDNILINTPGEFSAYNGICATLVTYLIGCKLESIKKALSKVAVKGRVEIVPVSNRFSVIIDYAHNGVSLENILTTMKAYNPKRIVSLFGCGGNRSKERRYDMGEISGKYSDLTIITEDNSRFEDVNDIMNDIEIGIKKTSGKYIKIANRTEAISYAINNAMDGDIILLLGKGHETYQEKNGERKHYDEREEIQKVLDKKKGNDNYGTI